GDSPPEDDGSRPRLRDDLRDALPDLPPRRPPAREHQGRGEAPPAEPRPRPRPRDPEAGAGGTVASPAGRGPLTTRREFLQDTTQGALAAWTALALPSPQVPSPPAPPPTAPSPPVLSTPAPIVGSDVGSLYPLVQSQAVKGEFPLSFLRGDSGDLAAWK